MTRISSRGGSTGNATSSSVLVPTAVKTASYTAAASDYVPVDTTSGNVTITLPTAPADKTQVGIKHVTRGGTNVVTLALGGSDVINKAGGATSGTLTLVNQAVVFQYKASSNIWYVISDDLPLSGLDTRYTTLVAPNFAALAANGDFASYDAASGLIKPQKPSIGLINFGGLSPFCVGPGIGGDANVGVGYASNTRMTCKVFAPVDEVRIVFWTGAYVNLNIPMGEEVAFTCSIQNVFGGIQPVSFSGRRTGYLSFGGILISDPVPLRFPSVDFTNTVYNTFDVLTHAVASASGYLLCVQTPETITPVQAEVGSGLADKTLDGAAISGTGGYKAYPTLILGKTRTRQPLVATYGDSITGGTADTGTSTNPVGFPNRALYAAGIPYVKLGFASRTIPGSNDTTGLKPSTQGPIVDLIFDGITHCIYQFGVNNINPSLATDSLSVLQAKFLDSWSLIARKGVKVYQTTLTPHTTGTFTSTAGQSINNTTENTTRTSVNDWIRDGAPTSAGVAVAVGTAGALRAGQPGHPLVGYFEVADAVESARNSGIWKANYTGDGIHPLAVGALAAAATINTSLFTV